MEPDPALSERELLEREGGLEWDEGEGNPIKDIELLNGSTVLNGEFPKGGENGVP